jgi:hypothetical protein
MLNMENKWSTAWRINGEVIIGEKPWRKVY